MHYALELLRALARAPYRGAALADRLGDPPAHQRALDRVRRHPRRTVLDRRWRARRGHREEGGVLLENLRPSLQGSLLRWRLSGAGARGDSGRRGRRRSRACWRSIASRAKPFTPHEHELAAQAARYCLRAIQNERVFVQLERAKVEQGKLYRAAQALGAALSERDVVEAGVRAAREIASFDLAAVTIWDETTRDARGLRGQRAMAARSTTSSASASSTTPGSSRWWSRTGFRSRTRASTTRRTRSCSHEAPPVAERSVAPRAAAAPPRPRARDAHPRGAAASCVRRHGAADARGSREPPRASASRTREWFTSSRRWRRPTA